MTNQPTTISAKIITYIYRSTGWCVAKVEKSDGDLASFTGEFGILEVGERATFTGTHVVNKRYGPQFQVTKFQQDANDLEASYIKMLASDKFPGIGKTTARRIAELFSGKIEETLSSNHQALTQIKGISKDKADEIHDIWMEEYQSLSVIRLFSEVGIRTAKVDLLIEKLGNDVLSLLESNPYVMLNYPGFTWQDAEKLGKHFQIDQQHPSRLQGAVRHSLQEYCKRQAETLCPLDVLIAKLFEITGVSFNAIHHAIVDAHSILVHLLYQGQHMVALRSYYEVESKLAAMITKKMTGESKVYTLRTALEPWLTDSQQQAVLNCFERPISIITGGPGTGKTTTIREIVKQAKALKLSFRMCAPTGRAAKQLEAVTKGEASTVHRLLQIVPNEETGVLAAEVNEHNPLKDDLIICDEWSMADMFLTSALFKGLSPHTRVVFVGDPDQLPSIGPGSILRDFLESNIPVQVLELNHRQADNSAIITLAYDIKRNELTDMGAYTGAVECIQAAPNAIPNIVNELVTTTLPAKYGCETDDIQVLSPVYDGVSGVTKLNEILRASLNPPTVERGNTQEVYTLRVGDRIMVTKNDSRLEVANGDMGVVTKVIKGQSMVEALIADRLVQFEGEDAKILTLAWTVTVHKSQGGEWPVIVMVVNSANSFMLHKALVYTAVTRAKNGLILVGDVRSLPAIIRNSLHRHRDRYTMLRFLLPGTNGVLPEQPHRYSMSEVAQLLIGESVYESNDEPDDYEDPPF